MWVLRKILFPFSLVYGFVVYVRNRWYDWSLLKSKSYKTPIVCVGNLSVGGTGKTPMIELLISMLKDTRKVAVLSRGYGRKSKGYLLVTPESTVEQVGDEPFQLFSKFKEIAVAVDADRQNGIAILERSIKPDIILLDDGFQHRKVTPSYAILLTTFENLYVDDWYLPTGNLRDHRGEAQRADIVIVTKFPDDGSDALRLEVKEKLNLKSKQKLLFSSLVYNDQLGGSGPFKKIEDLKDKEVTLLTGIANPKPLVDFLRKRKISFEHLAFKDHHFFTPKELAVFSKKSNILTTEKDYMRLAGRLERCNYITIEHRFLDGGYQLLEGYLKGFTKPYS